MMWMPPPHWLVAMLIALLAQLVVMGTVFARRGALRGLLSVPVGLLLFLVTAIGGMFADGAVWQIDPVPLVALLAAGVYGTYALMMWRSATTEAQAHAG